MTEGLIRNFFFYMQCNSSDTQQTIEIIHKTKHGELEGKKKYGPHIALV